MIRRCKRNGSQLVGGRSKVQRTAVSIMTSPITSASDKKTYRLIKLDNGLKALLIHHEFEPNPVHEEEEEHEHKLSTSESEAEHTESEDGEEMEHEREKLAAVALCVGAGSFQDHDYGIEGLAHFVEHMIFMGSEKYQKENELDQFLNANGGSSNAETECEYTLFYFDIVEEHLKDALDRFSSLFISPIMLRDAMQREMEAVESEFQNNINNDSDRVMQLIASKAEGCAGTFTWGNLKTLKENVDADKLYQSAHDFRKRFYTGMNMFLCIESAESLDDLQDIVKKYFSDIQSGSQFLRNSGCADPFVKDFYEKIYYIKPKSDKLKLYLTFVLPSMEKHYRTKPHDYVSYLIQHEGAGSLSAYLKKNLLALHVSAGATDQSFEGNSMFCLFGIDILLTEYGYENINQVIAATFGVLKLLKDTPMEEHKKTFMELKQIRDTSFEFREEKHSGEYTEELAVNIMFYEPEDIIGGSDKFYEFDEKMTSKIINIMNEGKFNIMVLTDKHSNYGITEKWFGTEYDEKDLPKPIKELWNARNYSPSEFFIPQPNEFICSKFDIVSKLERLDMNNHEAPPSRLEFNDIELWYKMDSKYLLPHGYISCYMISPKVFKSSRNIILVSLYSMTIKHYLAEKLYPAVCAGLGYSINSAERGLLIKLSGYNEKLPLLLELIAKELKNIPNQIEPLVFETYKKQLKKNGYNALINSKAFNKECRLTILEEQHDFCYDRFTLIDEIKFEELVTFAKDFPNELKVKMMMMGNFREIEAMQAAKILYQNLQCQNVVDETVLMPRCRKIPEGNHVLYVKSLLPNDKNSTITNYYQIAKSTIKTQCLVEFVEKFMEDPIFDTLRTKEMLGYSVGCSHRVNNGLIGFSVTLQIQEDKHTTKSVNDRIEKFLREDFQAFLYSLSDDDFEAVQSSLIKLKKMEEVEMESENNRHWNEITSNEYLFNRLDLEATMLERITKDEVQEFYKKILNSPKLSIQVIGNKEEEEEKVEGDRVPILKLLQGDGRRDEKVIGNINEFKNSLDFYEAWTTIVDL